jgi:hypothetical protein
MKNVTTVSKNQRILTVLLAGALGLSAASSDASETTEEAYDNITVTEQLSAYGAKRLALQFLFERGFSNGVGPGNARIKSITRDSDTWIVQVALSNGTHIMNKRAILYIDANSAMVSEVAPERTPRQVAEQ